jgi:hypothetical protein
MKRVTLKWFVKIPGERVEFARKLFEGRDDVLTLDGQFLFQVKGLDGKDTGDYGMYFLDITEVAEGEAA